MKSSNKRGSGLMMASDYKPKSTLNLEHPHSETVVEHPIGRKVKLTVHATKNSHRINSDGTHSSSYEVHKIEKEDNEKTDKKTEGKAEKASNDKDNDGDND